MNTAFQPVLLGGDIGIYALAREFFDAFAVRPIVFSEFETGPIAHSRILTYRPMPGPPDEDTLLATLLAFAREWKGPQLLLVANTDWRIRVLAAHREELAPYYVLPIPPSETVREVEDKQTFAALCARAGVPVPTTATEDFSQPTRHIDPNALPDGLQYPVIAKPAASSDYENLHFPGKHKVYQIKTPQELTQLWHRLETANFHGSFLVQELIPGDDTAMYSITAYADTTGALRLLSSAHVLLEEHHPQALGNPCAMITGASKPLFESTEKILSALEYHGFANFDIKRDPRTGTFYFLDLNPRIGRNNFYVQAAGVNPMQILVEDVIEHQEAGLSIAGAEALYSIIPRKLLLNYLRDPKLTALVNRLSREGKMIHPLRNPKDHSLYHAWYTTAALFNQRRKFHRYYPEPTDTGF